ncbi:MAG TPA: hypothetical protein VF265_04375 [Nevskiaceae bacterium]
MKRTVTARRADARTFVRGHQHTAFPATPVRVGRFGARRRSTILRRAGAVAAALAAAPAWSAPFSVTSAHVGVHTNLETEAQWAHAPGSNSWQAPKLKLEAPIIPRLLEIKLSDTYQVLQHSDMPTAHGWGDFEAEMKWAPVSERNGSAVDLAVEPKLHLPTGDATQKLGAGAPRVGLPLMVARRFGRAQLTGEVMYVHGFSTLPNAMEGGVLGTWQLRPRLLVGAEIYTVHTLQAGATTDVDANVGFKWHATQRWEFDALAGHRLNRTRERIKLVASYAF